jgi:hypothetical protein
LAGSTDAGNKWRVVSTKTASEASQAATSNALWT